MDITKRLTKNIVNVPIIDFFWSKIIQLLDWGCEEFVIITNPEFEDLIKKVTTEAFPSLNLKFATQDEPKGISHALKQAEVHVDRDEKILFILERKLKIILFVSVVEFI